MKKTDFDLKKYNLDFVIVKDEHGNLLGFNNSSLYKKPFRECYGSYGQGADDDESFTSCVNEEGDFVASASEMNWDDFLELCEADGNKIKSPLVLSYDYWDGNNWKSIIFGVEDDYQNDIFPHYEVVEYEIQQQINKEYDDSEFIKEVYGSSIYESNSYIFKKSAFAYIAESFSVENK